MNRDEVRAEFEELRVLIPELEAHVVPPGTFDRLVLPDGFHLSRSLERLLREGGPWIGGPPWGGFPRAQDKLDRTLPVAQMLRAIPNVVRELPDGFGVRWVEVYWQQPFCVLAAATPEQYESAPLLIDYGEDGDVVLLFPDEDELVQAYELAVVSDPEDAADGGNGMVSDYFLLWLTKSPPRRPEHRLLFQRLDELSATWHSEHPCWVPEWMPLGVAPEARELPERCVREAPEDVLRAVFQMPDDYEIPVRALI